MVQQKFISVNSPQGEFIGYYSVLSENETHYEASPKGGGFVCSIPKANCTEITIIPDALKECRVTWSDAGESFNAIVNVNDVWNGWLMPYLTKSEVEKLVQLKHLHDDYQIFEINAAGILVMELDGDSETIEPSEIIFNNEIISVYHFDNGWCWEEDVQERNGFIVLQRMMGSVQPIFREDEDLCFFDTQDEANEEIQDCLNGVKDAVQRGDMDSEYDENDYIVIPATLRGNRIFCAFDGTEYSMDRKDDDLQEILPVTSQG